jgi:glycosyltransferase involved in cell wall biosynthesis
MKILQTIHGIDKNSGGSSTYMKLLAEELAKHADVSIATLDTGNNLEIKNNVECYYAPVSGLRSFGYSNQLNRFVRSLDADIFHGNGLWQYPVHAMVNAAKAKNKPYIISPHGMMEPWSLTQGRIKKQFLMAMFQANDLRSANVIHATGNLEAANVRNCGFDNPIAVIPNGIDLTEFKVRTQKPEASHKTLLFFSRIHPKKGIEMLIDIWKQLDAAVKRGWKLTIAGNGEPSYVRTLDARITEANLQGEVEIIGPVWGEGKAKLYRSAELFILPTHSENFGIVVAEALACGVPVITTKGAPWEDLIKQGCGWWVDIDRRPIRHALEQAMMLSTRERMNMGLQGRTLVEEKYSIQVVAKQMMELYHWVMGKTRRPDFVI